MNGPAPGLLGHLHQHEDGALDGWCWAPDRPHERLLIDILVEDRVAVSMVAAMFRPDVLAQGCGDGCHGFALRLPPGLEAAGECLITARERRTRRVFGRALRRFPGQSATVARVAAAEAVAEEAWARAAALRQTLTAPTPSDATRAAFGVLARELQARCDGVRRPRPGPALPLPSREPAFGVVIVPASADAAERQLAGLAPVLGDDAEVLAADPGVDPEAATLPARVRHLRYVRDPRAATASGALALAAATLQARRLVLLAAPALSGAAWLALRRAWDAGGAAAVVAAWGEPLDIRLPGPLGLIAGIERAVLDEALPPGLPLPQSPAEAAAELAVRVRLLSRRVLTVGEPPAPRGA